MLVCTCKCVRNHSSGRACVWLFIVVWRDAAGVAAQKKETDKKLREEREQKKNEAFCELRGAQPALTPPRLLLVEAFHETLFTFSSIQRVNLHKLECLQWHWNCCLTVMNEKGAATLLYVLQCRHPSNFFFFTCQISFQFYCIVSCGTSYSYSTYWNVLHWVRDMCFRIGIISSQCILDAKTAQWPAFPIGLKGECDWCRHLDSTVA